MPFLSISSIILANLLFWTCHPVVSTCKHIHCAGILWEFSWVSFWFPRAKLSDWLINNVPHLLFGWREATTGKMSFCRLEKQYSNKFYLEPMTTRSIMWTLIHVISMEFWGLNCRCLHCETSQAASRDACTCRLLSHRLLSFQFNTGWNERSFWKILRGT